MNREILFRGQTRKFGEKVNMNGEKQPGIWVYGGIFYGKGDFSIIYHGETGNEIEKHVVYTDTVGEFIGVRAKDSKCIFEGDIVTAWSQGSTGTFIIKLREDGGNCPMWLLWPAWKYDQFWNIAASREQDGLIYDRGLEVIGNIHDNPELIGGAI